MMLARLGSGNNDPEAWSRFVLVYGPQVVRWCRNYGLQEADAHDVAQDVLLQFSKQIGRFEYDPSKSFRGWLRTLVHASWYAWVNRKRDWHTGTGDVKAQSLLEELPARENLVARLEEEYDRELLELAIEHVRNRVEAHTWETFRLLALDNVSGKEVAEKLALKLNTVYAIRNKVQRMIREEMARLDPPE